MLCCWQEGTNSCTAKKIYFDYKQNLNLMSAMEEHWIIQNPEGCHNPDEISLTEIVLPLSDVIDHLVLCQVILDPLGLLELERSIIDRKGILME